MALVREPIICSLETEVAEAIAQMNRVQALLLNAADADALEIAHLKIRASCVIAIGNNQVAGMLTAAGVVALLGQQLGFDGLTLAEVMVPAQITLQESDFTDLEAAYDLLQRYQLSHLLVVNQNRWPVGVITETSLNRAIRPLEPYRYAKVPGDPDSPVIPIRSNPPPTVLPKVRNAAGNQTLQAAATSTIDIQSRCSQLENINRELQLALEELSTSREELIQRNQQLEVEHQQYVDLFELAPDGYLITSLTGCIERTNQRLLRRLATESKFLLGKSLLMFIPAADRCAFYAQIRQIIHQPQQQAWQTTLVPRQGSPFSAEITIAPIYDANNTLTKLCWIVRDISDRKQVEATLWQSELAKRTIIESIPDLLIHMDRHGRCRHLSVGTHVQVKVPVPPSDFYNYNIYDVLPHDIADRRMQYLHEALASGSLQIYEQILTIEGRQCYEEVRIAPLSSEEVLVIVRDISDRKQAETTLTNLVAATASTTGSDFFPTLVEHMARALNVSHVLVTEQVDQQLRILALWGDGALQSNFSYNLANTPCEHVLQQGEYCCESSVQERFPKDAILSTWGVDSYLGLALHNCHGEVVGHFCILNSQPIANLAQTQNLMSVFAARAASELERQQMSNALAQLNQELEIKVTQRTQQLQDSQAKLQAILDFSPSLIYVKDLAGRHTLVNQAFLKSFNCTAADVIGKTNHEIFPSKTANCLQVNDLALLDGSDFLQFEETIPVGNTDYVFLSSKFLLRNQDDQPYAICGISADISDRKQTELTLAQNAQEIENLYNNAPCGYHALDVSGRILRVNNTELEWLGYRHEEMIGRPFTDFVFESYRPVHDQNIAHVQTLLPQHSVNFEICLQDCNGIQLPVYLSYKTYRNAQGQLLGVQATMMDIRQQKIAERTIRWQAQRESLLRQVSQRIRQTLDLATIFETACHEIRTAISGDRVAIFKFEPSSSLKVGAFVAESVASGIASAMDSPVDIRSFGANYASLYHQGFTSIVADIQEHDLDTSHRNTLIHLQVQTNLVVPLLCGQQLWGLLCVQQCTRSRRWEPADIDLISQLANQLAIATQQASLYDRIQTELQVRQQAETRIKQQLRQQKIVSIIVRRVRESLDLGEILATTTRLVKELLCCDRVIILRLFANGYSEIVEEAVSDEFPAFKFRHFENESWAQEVLDIYWQGRPRIIPDTMTDQWTSCLQDYCREGQIQSKIVAPILQDWHGQAPHRWVAPCELDKLWGILVAHSCREQRAWEESEAQLLQQIANQLSIAVQQAGLFEQLQKELAERQQTQQQLTESNAQLAISNNELAQATRLKDEFLASMSHELRTPLNAILGMAEGLREQVFGKLTPQQLQSLQTIERSGSHLLELINDILDVAKVESGKMKLHYTPTSVSVLCQSSLSFIEQHAWRKDIRLENKLATNLPRVLLDERRMRQVLINLLSNAVKFTPEGGSITLEGTLLPSNHRYPNRLCLAVSDTGIGIPADKFDSLFQPFVQIDSALNRKYNGTGLGLTLVKQIVNLHGGEIELSSVVGSGSCFSLYLPCNEANADPITSDADLGQLRDQAPDHQQASPVVLLVNDNAAHTMTIANYLGAKGYLSRIAVTHQEAIDYVCDHRTHAILMNVQVSELNVIEAIGQLRRHLHPKQVPIVVMSTPINNSDRQRYLEAGANEHLVIPARMGQLVAVIHRLLTH